MSILDRQALIIQNKDLKAQVHNLKTENFELKHTIKDMETKHKKEIVFLNSKINNILADFAKFHNELVEVKTELDNIKKENIMLKETIKIKDTQIIKLENEVDRLKKQINNDSNNSSKPPSSDIKKNIPNNREKSNNNIGGQKGHKAHFLSKEDVVNKIKDNTFNHEIINVGVLSDNFISKFVLDIDISINAVEYRFYQDKNRKFNIPKEFKNDVQYGSELKTLCAILNTEGIVAINRLSEFVKSITKNKINISTGTIVNFVNNLAKKSTKILGDIENGVLNSDVAYTDATSVRCNNKNVSVRNYSTKKHTLLKATLTKSKKDIDATNILPRYTGNLCHDHEVLMYKYGKNHGECNAHISRYLQGCYDNTKNSWCLKLRSFLCSLNSYKKELQFKNINKLDEVKLKKYTDRYDEIIDLGYEQNESVSSKFYKKEELKLLNRLKKYRDNHLMFIFDFDMPFDNNLSERDLRHVKSKQKVSGYFNSLEGLQNYLDIKSLIITCKKQGKNFYNIIRNIYANQPIQI